MKGFYKMGRVVVVTFDENEEEKLNELLHAYSAKTEHSLRMSGALFR